MGILPMNPGLRVKSTSSDRVHGQDAHATRFRQSVSRTLISVLCLAGMAWAQEAAPGLHWYSNYEEARAEAKRTDKPIFLEFRCAP